MFEEEKIYKVQVNTTIDVKVKQLADSYQISPSQALEFGLKFLLAEKTKGMDFEFPSNSLSYKIGKMSEIIEQQASKITELEKAIAFRGTEKKDDNKELTDTELKDILGNGEPK